MLVPTNIVKPLVWRVRACEHTGMGNTLRAADIDRAVARFLDEALAASPLSLRALTRESGVKLTRLGDVLRRGSPLTVGELDAISAALGLVGWEVMREVEEGVVVDVALDGVVIELPAQQQPEGSGQ